MLLTPSLRFVASTFPTGAVERLGQLGGHDLDDEADAETEHLAEQLGLSPDAHGQVHHDLLRGEKGGGGQSEEVGGCM